MTNRTMGNGVVAHSMVAKTAVEMAQTLYEGVAGDNELLAQWKRQCPKLEPKALRKLFVSQMAPLLLDAARATLAKLLTTSLAEGLKDQIADALIKDKVLGRVPPTPQRQRITIER